MKIGIDARELKEKRVGIGTYVYQIIKQLNMFDSQNEYFLYSNKPIFIDFKLNKNWHIREFEDKIGTSFVYNKLPKILENDKINLFWGTEHCLPKRNKHTNNISFVLTIHDLAIQKFKKVGSFYNEIIQRIILKKSCENADKIIAISNATKKDLKDIYNINENKIKVIYEGTNDSVKKNIITNEDEIIRKYNLDKDKFIFFLSTIEPRKNLITIIKAFEEYKAKNVNKLKLIISGGLGWRYKNILEVIKNSKFKKDIIMTGYISNDEKEFFYKKCEFFVFPSLYEGFGLPVLEAMKRGAIVVTSNISSLPEVGGQAAFYLDNIYDYKELSNIYEKVLKLTKEEKEKIIKSGYAQVNKFSWKKCAQETYEVFMGVVE